MRAYRLRVYGRVQRVGYRRHLLDLAQELSLAGSVENLPDGSVEVHVQGEEEAINRFIEGIGKHWLGSVKRVDKTMRPLKPDVEYFRVIYGEIVEEISEGFSTMQMEIREMKKQLHEFRMELRET